jgi:hypothetical protein
MLGKRQILPCLFASALFVACSSGTKPPPTSTLTDTMTATATATTTATVTMTTTTTGTEIGTTTSTTTATTTITTTTTTTRTTTSTATATAPPPKQWIDSGDDIQDVSPWGSAGPGIGAPAPGTYLGSNPSYDPGCYRYFSAAGTGDGTSAATPAGNAVEMINAICASTTARVQANGKKLCFKRGDEFRGAFGGMNHSLLTLSWCSNISLEDYGDQRVPRPRILGSRIAPANWTAASDPRIQRLDLTGFLLPGYSWTNQGKTLTDEERVGQVFLGGKKLLLARHPNFGEGKTNPTVSPRMDPTVNSMLFMEQNLSDSKAFRDSKLPSTSPLQNPVDWTGATAIFKWAGWIIDGSRVVSYDAAKQIITTKSAPAESQEVNKGYFLLNHIAALDQPGEWYYDAKTKTLYLWPPDGVDLNSQRVDLSFGRYNTPKASWDSNPVDHGGLNAFYTQYGSGITLKNLEVAHFSGQAVEVGSPGLTIQDCLFSGFGQTVLQLGFNLAEATTLKLGNAPLRVENNHILDAGCNGILIDIPDSVTSHNTLRNIGTLEQWGPSGMGLDGDGCGLTYHETGFGVKMGTENHQTASYNFLERIGHNGVGYHGPNSVVENNVIHLASVTKADSGGVKCWAWDGALNAAQNLALPGVSGSVVRKNIVVETVGTAEGGTVPGVALGDGFFIDFGCQNSTFSDNIAARNTTIGFLMSRGRNHDMLGNLAFGNGTTGGTQIDIGDCQTSPCPNSLKNNVMVSTSSQEKSFFVYSLSAYTGDGNAFFDPFDAPTLDYKFNIWQPNTCGISQGTDIATCYSLSSWRAATGGDATSKAASFLWRDEFPSDYLSEPLVANPTFDSGVQGWGGDMTPDATTVLGPAGRLDLTRATSLLLGTFAAKKGATYEIRARTLGANAMEPWLTLDLMTHNWVSIIEPLPTGVGALPVTSKPLENGILFKAAADEAAAWIQLSTKASKTWVDDAYLRQVESYKVPRGVVLRPGDAVPKGARIVLYINPSTVAQEVNLGADTLYDLDGKAFTGAFPIAAMAGQVLIAGAKLGLGKSTRDFGVVSAGSLAKQMPVLASIGSQPLAITSVTIKEPGTPFSVSNACDGKTMPISGVCAVDLVYAPTEAGEHTATLVIVSNDGQGTERNVALKGSAK